MKPEFSLIWYFSYGSNLLPGRFHCYIQGGQLPGHSKIHSGCTDPTLPAQQKSHQIPHYLYYAGYSTNWQGGVAFIDPYMAKGCVTLGGMYLISQQQFLEIVKQENDLSEEVDIDLNKVRQKRGMILPGAEWYNQILYLGSDTGFPIFTFTQTPKSAVFSPPSTHYLSTIITGIKGFHPLPTPELFRYFRQQDGILNHYSDNELIELLETL